MKKTFEWGHKAYLAILALTPVMMTVIIELSSNQEPGEIKPVFMVIEAAICLLIEGIFLGLLPFGALGLILIYSLAMFFGLANYYLLKFRDIPFMFMDLFSAETAANVMDSYDFSIEPKVFISLLLGVIFIVLSKIFYPSFKEWADERITYKKSALFGLASTGLLFSLIFFVGFSSTFGIVMNMWKPGKTYAENGAVPSFISFAQFSLVDEPEGYDKEEVEKILLAAAEEYDGSHKSLENDIKPTIISIMDEAFSDLSVLGTLDCTDEHLSFYKSLKSDPGTIWHGYTYVSTYAGGTARTEFEWLTGYSMRMFSNAQPYSQFNFEDIYTSLDNVLSNGYEAIAMHPENPTNYRRNTAYEQMGFSRYFSREDYEGYEESEIVPGRISDLGDFNLLIDEDEKREGPLFIHNVTMQNHGGYGFELDEDEMADVDYEYKDFDELRKYEALLDDTDEALQRLIEHYRESDDPVIICFYGDHLPNMDDKVTTRLMFDGYDPEIGKVANEERRFKVPFFIWANYDVGDHIKGYALNGELVTSPNYLGVVTRADAGLKLSAYDKYLLLLREKVPVVNESGYVADKRWFARDEESEYLELLNEYEKVQYAGMFDNENLSYLFTVEDNYGKE